MLRSTIAYSILTTSYSAVLLISRLLRYRRRSPQQPSGFILVTGTFYNMGWFRSHAEPLARCCRKVTFIADEPLETPEGVEFACPPRWLRRITGRAISKLVWMIRTGIRLRPDLYMGYHIFPGALTALVAGRLLGRPTCYQMTGGPIEVAGGGAHNENRLMSSLGRPSAFLERLALRIVREFDLVIVRGEKARTFLGGHGLNGSVRVIPGSIPDGFAGLPSRDEESPVGDDASPGGAHWADRRYDLTFVGRLAEIKQPLQFVEIVAAVVREVPSVRAAVVGDGPLEAAMRKQAAALGLSRRIEFLGRIDTAGPVLTASRTFVLTSRSEGLSIAMLEAMVAGAVPVVANVGELSDVVRDGHNGFLVQSGDTGAYTRRIVELLSHPNDWRRLSRSAAHDAREYASVECVAMRWRRCLGGRTDGTADRVSAARDGEPRSLPRDLS